ncbi:MAG: MFS transporter [Candidatus Paracaedibacteraceae bacterium]|nr:MFS transporter [Candidatus Paracaedibacteraceae bacterium]
MVKIKAQLAQTFRMSPDPISNRSLWAISWVSFFGGMASLMVFSILSLFMRDELHLTYRELGHIEGFAIFMAFMAKVFSGILSDYMKSRKSLILLGTFASILIKPMFALAGGMFWIFFARTVDRFSKGIRAAPTDALIADLSPSKGEGTSFGIRYTLYALGFMCGGSLSSLLMHLSSNNYRLVFWLALIPATLSFIILYIYVAEPRVDIMKNTSRNREWKWRDIRHLPNTFWHLLVVTFILMNARFSESFLSLRAKDLGFAIAAIPLTMILYNLVEAFAAMPTGKLADKFNRKKILLAGILVLALTNFIMISVPFKESIWIGMLLAGLHMGMTQGLLGTLVAESTLPHLRGTAFALYYFVVGIAVLTGNHVAGYLSDFMNGAIGAFWGGLFFTVLASLYLIAILRKNISIGNQAF